MTFTTRNKHKDLKTQMLVCPTSSKEYVTYNNVVYCVWVTDLHFAESLQHTPPESRPRPVYLVVDRGRQGSSASSQQSDYTATATQRAW